jgi:hypothetical protein
MKDSYLENFSNYEYYFMWIFSLKKEFGEALEKVKQLKRPYDDKIFDILDDLIEKA